LLAVIIITAIVFLSCKKRRDLVTGSCRERKLVVREDLRVKIASYEQILKVFEFEKVKKATEKFSFESRIKGSVYRGEFGGEILAVKKMRRDVIKEVNILKRVNHLNLIKLEGVCENLGCFYLVLEYMGNGSLRELLFCKKSKESGNWTKRIQIALDVANGLNYLHSFTEPAYVHRAPGH
jgi:serine/threonine protein kinase